MELIHKETGEVCYSSKFNTHALGEIIVNYNDGSASSDFMSNYKAKLPNGETKPLKKAIEDSDIKVDDKRTSFYLVEGDKND